VNGTSLDRLRSAGRRFAGSPGAQLIACGILLALAFPSRSSGAIGLTVIAGAAGIGVALALPHAPAWVRQPPAHLASAVVLTIVVASGLTVFWDAMTVAPDWQMGDWGPQRAVLARMMPSVPGLDPPVWNHIVGTGDAPLELYPAFTYLVTGHVAAAFGLEHDLPLALMAVAVLVHIGIAATTTAIAMKIAPRPIALVVGLLALVDTGAVAHGGTVGLFRWALLHSALALLFSTIAALGVLSALKRPRIGASVAIWVATALATVTHPAGLISATAAILALAAVALLAHDVPPRRALVAMGHVALGVALGAVVWMPLAERILAYGQHFPNALRTPLKLLEDLLAWSTPVTAYAMLAYAGFLGIVAGLWSRRALVVFVSATALVLLLGMTDAPYLAYDLAPGKGVARLGTERLAQLARPFLAACGAYTIALVFGTTIRGWKGASQRQRLIAAALIGIMSGAVIRVLPLFWRNATARAAAEASVIAPDPIGRERLTSWAAAQAATLRPDAWGRALFEEDTHEHLHLTAETGLPTFHMPPQPDLLLRERIEDTSAASLARFNVKWVVAIDKSPSLGDADSEIILGSYHIRELRAWDGQFARIEKGAGKVKVLRLDDRAVEIEVTGTTEPVLVALGTGYYPRWRARHASGAPEPVYAYPTIPNGKLHVVSAWVAPGRTTFTVDGPLPSDGDGRVLSILAALLAVAGIVVWSVRRWRLRVLRGIAGLRERLPRVVWLAAHVGVPLACIALLARGCADRQSIARDLELGTGVRATATVEARTGNGAWESCGYSRIEGVFYCEGLIVAQDATVNLLNDAAPSWAFTTPGVLASASQVDAEIRIRTRARLGGKYWTAVNDGTVTLDVEQEDPRTLRRGILTYDDRGERDIEIRSKVPMSGWQFTFVREDTLQPDRTFLDGPPSEPPPELRSVRP
jgi:hypothetical protein